MRKRPRGACASRPRRGCRAGDGSSPAACTAAGGRFVVRVSPRRLPSNPGGAPLEPRTPTSSRHALKRSRAAEPLPTQRPIDQPRTAGNAPPACAASALALPIPESRRRRLRAELQRNELERIILSSAIAAIQLLRTRPPPPLLAANSTVARPLPQAEQGPTQGARWLPERTCSDRLDLGVGRARRRGDPQVASHGGQRP